MRTTDKILTKAYNRYGAQMGRSDVGECPLPFEGRVYDCHVPLDSGAYDKGGAYWGFPNNLRVRYTKDLSYIHFYRKY